MDTEYYINEAISYGKSLIGKPYGWWLGGNISTGEPMWACNEISPPISEITSTSCSGLLNLILRHLNITLSHSENGGIGGTLAYFEYYNKQKFDINNILPKSVSFQLDNVLPNGTIIGRNYRDIYDQGNVGIVVDGMVLQSIPNIGVNMDYTIRESHSGYYYDYIVFPDQWLYK